MSNVHDWSKAKVITVFRTDQTYLVGPESPKPMTWHEAKEWCESIGGALPDREALLVLLRYFHEDFKGLYKQISYWASDELRGYNRDQERQIIRKKSDKLMTIAMRKVSN